MSARDLNRTIAEEALARCGISGERLVRLRGGIVNDVWRAGRDAVVRIGRLADTDNLNRAAAALDALHGRVRVPKVLLLDACSWPRPVMVCSYVPGRPMDRAWPNWDAATRTSALEQIIAEFERLHRTKECPGPFDDWQAGRKRQVEALLETLGPSGVDRRLAARLSAEWKRVGHALPGDDVCLIHGDFNGGNAVFRSGSLSGLIDFDDAVIAPRALDYWCMGTVLNEPPFGLPPRRIRALLAPLYRFDGQADAWQAEQLYWTLRGLIDPFARDAPAERAGDAWQDLARYFDDPGFLKNWFD